MSRHPVVLILLAVSLAQVSGSEDYNRLRSSLDNFTSYSYDEIHKLVILDQIEAYKRPIKSIETKDVRSLNGLYDFCFDPSARGFSEKWFEKSIIETCSDDNYYRMPVPSAFNDILSNKTAKNYVGWMWYQKTMSWQSKPTSRGMRRAAFSDSMLTNWILQLESIHYLSIIWLQEINFGKVESHLVGSHVGGHLPITLDVTSILNSITCGYCELRLTIAVNNLLTENTIPSGRMLNMTEYTGRPYYKFQPDFDFFNFAGIMGDVMLISLPRYFIEDVEIVTANNRQGLNGVQAKVLLNAPIKHSPHHITYFIEGLSDKIIVRFKYWPPGGIPENQTAIDGSPVEARCRLVTLCDNDLSCKEFDRVGWPLTGTKKPIRIRFILHIGEVYILTGGNEQEQDLFELELFLRRNVNDLLWTPNGKQRQLQGFGMHHEQLFSGRTMSLSSIMKDLYLLKQMGANVIRTSHYPYSRAYLDACDELGMMVIAECPAVGLGTFNDIKLLLHKQLLLEMMQRDHDHPSIAMWSLANEPQSQLPEARGYFQTLVHYARNDLRRFTINAGRPLTAALAQSAGDDKIGDLFDVLMINRYYGWYECTGMIECVRHSLLDSLTKWSLKYGHSKPLLLSEFGADTLAGVHSSTVEIFSEEYQRDLIVEHERLFDELFSNRSQPGAGPNFIGAMIWNFADFSTHESLMRMGGNKKGIFSASREPKLAAASVKQIYHSRLARSSAHK
jgi:beta-glucuronidase